ncbi:hypothetical protein [Streptomyces sp. NRRL S-87]|uniref:hypothetical protein n=1 Tax=Streptomyces sp. NRRL S-87 TaxID=1463920 RepID=UPI00099CFCB9|nr:hypothetical protein [Streptomyces sp. NRRL S-87]
MPRPTAAQLAYGSATVIASTLAMLLLSQTSTGLGVAVISAAALLLGLLVALTVPLPRRAAHRSARESAATSAAGPAAARTAAGTQVRSDSAGDLAGGRVPEPRSAVDADGPPAARAPQQQPAQAPAARG